MHDFVAVVTVCVCVCLPGRRPDQNSSRAGEQGVRPHVIRPEQLLEGRVRAIQTLLYAFSHILIF